MTVEILAHSKLTLHGRALGNIEKRSRALFEKGKIARALDKAQDSEEVVKLVEELRRAVLVYQVSIKCTEFHGH